MGSLSFLGDGDLDTDYDLLMAYINQMYDQYPSNLIRGLTTHDEDIRQGIDDALGQFAARRGLNIGEVRQHVRELSRSDVVVANIGAAVSDNGGLCGIVLIAMIAIVVVGMAVMALAYGGG